MTDDQWRQRGDDDFSEFGSLFDDSAPTENLPGTPAAPRRPDDDRLSFDDESGPLPHWSEPATGEVPRFESGASADDDDELDVWSSFSSGAPVWQDDPVPDGQPTSELTEASGVAASAATASGQHRRVTDDSADVPREPSRITIGTDPSGIQRRPEYGDRRRGGRGRPGAPPQSRVGAVPPSGRDMPTAIAVGVLLVAVFIAALIFDTRAVLAVIVAILGLGAIEFYDKVSERGYRPALFPGILTCVAAPLAAYWLGVGTLPLVMAFGFMAAAGGFLGARSVEAGPMPNVSITTLGMVWIGLLGSFAALILRLSTQPVSAIETIQALAENRGTDTLFLVALGVVANDVGALFIGSAMGRTSLRPWVSPNKTVEGLIGGGAFTIIALLFVGIAELSTTWVSTWHLLLLAIVIAVLAPLGDLVESMFKRNLDVKDFGTLVRGHGGILDRFDGFLFVLPAAYYLTMVLEPWTKYVPAAG